MSERSIDLSALDPSRDPGRWDAIAESVAARGLAARRRRNTVSYQVRAWAWPALAVAAAVALVSWVGALTQPAEPAVATEPEPAFVLAQWASADERPSTDQMLQVLGASHGSE